MSFKIIHGDIVESRTDAIVNAANKELEMGSGVCGAIYRAAGAEKLKPAAKKLAPIKTGQAVITPGFDLSADYIIHTAGPVYDPAKKEESRRLLEDSYRNSLKLAKDKGLKSVAFPLISAGIYRYPKEEALEVARQTIEDFLKENEMEVYLVLFEA